MNSVTDSGRERNYSEIKFNEKPLWSKTGDELSFRRPRQSSNTLINNLTEADLAALEAAVHQRRRQIKAEKALAILSDSGIAGKFLDSCKGLNLGTQKDYRSLKYKGDYYQIDDAMQNLGFLFPDKYWNQFNYDYFDDRSLKDKIQCVWIGGEQSFNMVHSSVIVQVLQKLIKHNYWEV